MRPVANRRELFELLASGNNGDAAAGVLDESADLLAGEGGVDGHVGGADGERGEVAHGPFPAVLADEGNAVALLRTPIEQGFAERADALVHLVRRDGAPAAEFVLP